MLAITGATGHTGHYLIENLKENNYTDRIRCLVRSEAKAAKLFDNSLNIEVVKGNLGIEENIYAFLKNVDTVVHIANIHYSLDILRIGKECGVKRFILIHTTGIYSKYKMASQEYIEIEKQIKPFMQEMNITILRPTMIFGDMCDHNISKFIRLVDRFPVLPVVAGGKATIQPVNARDLANAIYLVMKTEETCGNAYDLSGETVITIRELYKMISKYLGKKRLIISIPMWLAVLGAKIIKMLTRKRVDLIEKVLRMGEDRAYTHDEAIDDFGYAPEKFEIGLHREITQYLND